MSSALVKKLPMDATLVDLLVDGFEKNELLRGFTGAPLPLATERAPNSSSARSSPAAPALSPTG